MTNEELDQFKAYVREQSKDHRGEVSYPMMTGYLLGVIADLSMEFPQVTHKLVSRMQSDTPSK